MTRPSAVWRLVIRLERAMPWRESVLAPPAGEARRKKAATLLIGLLPITIITAARLRRGDLGSMWASSHGTVEGLVLIVAGVCLLAVIAAAIVTWRREAGRHA